LLPSGSFSGIVIVKNPGVIESSPVRNGFDRFRKIFSHSQIHFAAGAILLFALTLAVYLPILPGSFVMDDMRLVAGAANPLVSGELTVRSVWFQTDFP